MPLDEARHYFDIHVVFKSHLFQRLLVGRIKLKLAKLIAI